MVLNMHNKIRAIFWLFRPSDQRANTTHRRNFLEVVLTPVRYVIPIQDTLCTPTTVGNHHLHAQITHGSMTLMYHLFSWIEHGQSIFLVTIEQVLVPNLKGPEITYFAKVHSKS